MQHQALASCANCWFNGLQYGSVGLNVGYCTEHRLVLRRPDETTCGRQIRKDLLLPSAKAFQNRHQEYFAIDKITILSARETIANGGFVEKDPSFIRHDQVGDVVADYGEYETKIESLAQLRTLGTFRSELALLSLGRAYTNRCVTRGGLWTSGIHLFWWIKQRLLKEELSEPTPSDLRYSATGSLDRQVELASWSLLMLRLTFISDLGVHSKGNNDSIESLSEIAEQAALDTDIPSKRKLLVWIKKRGNKMLEQEMPESRYREITLRLHR